MIEADDFVSWDDFSGWRPRFEEEVLVPLLSGRKACYQMRDWERDEFRSSLQRERKLPWVEAPRDQRLKRGLARDGEGHRDLWLRWQDVEERFFSEDDTRSRADLVVDGAGCQDGVRAARF
ncbi:hypothetical protein [Amycolatopsis sp. GM8]|uniref:hypothetical protein n=1 Tax=Amycolatopsis sp. GM8 TaxID=2896530 RepID=UPI001F16DAA0|nr:hypothetical protein [Amycolatopsis sp. GM8]